MSFLIGLAKEDRYQKFCAKKQKVEKIKGFLNETYAYPDEMNGLLERNGSTKIEQKVKLSYLLLRPQLSLNDMAEALPALEALKTSDRFLKECLEEAEIQIKYDSYIQKENELSDKLRRLENVRLPNNFDYHDLQSLSYESREKLNRYQPETLGQASRISGISPADISVLAIYLGR